MDKPTNHTILKRMLGPADPELLCDECFEKLDVYIDLELQGAPADEQVPGCGRTSKGVPPATRNTPACVRWFRRASPTRRRLKRQPGGARGR
jgi:hypothetical protein